MVDHAAWILRAEAFVRGLNHLPGDWGISIDVEPPLSNDEAKHIAASLSFPLPKPLREFYTTASARCSCRYSWSPGLDMIDTFDEVLSSRSIYGGPDFFKAAELGYHTDGAHSWVENGIIESDQDLQRALLDMWLHTIPFVAVGNGDYVGLCCMPDSTEMPVVYLCHDGTDGPVMFISPSFEQFMVDWERLRYLGPEIWLLDVFRNEDKQTLDVTGERATALRSLMERYSRAAL